MTIGSEASVNGAPGTETVKDVGTEPAAPTNPVSVDWELVTEYDVTKAKCSKEFYTEGYGVDGDVVKYYAEEIRQRVMPS